MPDRYHIHIAPTAPRFQRVGKYGAEDWREDCSRCKNCVKHRCLYDVYRKEGAFNRNPDASVEPLYECKACLSCVQGCTKGLLSLTLNPEFRALGDAYWKPEILNTTWNQADTGRIPVSGAGYRGRFSGPGFDAMWTDMSEIVRPTRDGIHGREYISTAVDIGSKPMRLNFDAKGELTNSAALLEVQFPALLDSPPWGEMSQTLILARAKAATALKTLAIIPASALNAIPEANRADVVPLFKGGDVPSAESLAAVRMAALVDGPQVTQLAAELRARKPDLMLMVRVIVRPDCAERAVALHAAGLSILQLCADANGRERDSQNPRFIKEVLRDVHGQLVKRGVRDEVTLIGSGGIALAEHMAKAIICGADLVSVDLPLLIALGCRVCAGDHNGHCPAKVAHAEVAYAAQRMVNLMGAWHNQLIEVLGAMGIREVRRLRGEVGRAMFWEDLERDAFKELARIG